MRRRFRPMASQSSSGTGKPRLTPRRTIPNGAPLLPRAKERQSAREWLTPRANYGTTMQ
jgi:hypothetical protein